MFLESLHSKATLRVVTFQLAKASTSVGANYEEAQGAESSKDFIHKIGIVSKEVRESNHWLRVLDKILDEQFKNGKFNHILKESFELKKIFTSIKMTAQQNQVK